jgi:hypothetical protein
VDPGVRDTFVKDINEIIDWLYDNDSRTATKQQLESKLFVFKTIGEPIKRRYNYYNELDVYFKQFDNIC